MLKLVIGLGALLMLVGFGAAGWQYVQTLPPAEVAADGAAEVGGLGTPGQNWMISRSGGLVAGDDVAAYLVQDRFVERRTVVITQRAALESLLSDGEKLPEAPYVQVLADIRAPKVAAGACAALQEELAQDCAVHSARVVDGSVDRATGTAQFRIELAFTLKPSEAALPDLSARAFGTEMVTLAVEPGQDGAATVPDVIRSTVSAANAACAAQRRSEGCRVMRMNLVWEGDGAGALQAEIGSLSPLPKGMFPAPPLG
ncbi:hypothetical protein [Tabrizicola sp. BL-A-41-H6]|uniref:hypothetical protein n=1 Tax=Tabrizicola sp. BL-A-41-H6 TaxID=3421107 RepID=UPI003D674D2C